MQFYATMMRFIIVPVVPKEVKEAEAETAPAPKEMLPVNGDEGDDCPLLGAE